MKKTISRKQNPEENLNLSQAILGNDNSIPNYGKDDPYIGKESNFQISAMWYIKFKYPKALVYHVPNGGQRSKSEAARFKKEGVLAGIPDINIDTTNHPFDNPDYFGARIELKVKGGKLQKAQIKILNQLQENGFFVAVCWSIDGLVMCLKEYFGK